MEDEICPYATFHLLGFREEMDPTKAMNFQTFPHQNGTATPGHTGTMGTGSAAHMHSRSGSQSMVRYQLLNSLLYLFYLYSFKSNKTIILNLFHVFRFSLIRIVMPGRIAKVARVPFTHRHLNMMILQIALRRINM